MEQAKMITPIENNVTPEDAEVKTEAPKPEDNISLKTETANEEESKSEAEIQEKLAAAIAEADKWKALSRKNESHASQNAEAKNSLEKRLAALEAEYASERETAAKAQRELLVSSAVTEAGLPKDALLLIKGNTEEEITAEITALKNLVGAKTEEKTEKTFSPTWLTASSKSEPALSEDEFFSALSQKK